MDNTEFGNAPIALIGMSCKFAGDASDPENLWKMLIEGRDAWSEIPSSRFQVNGVYHPRHENISTTNVRGGHFLQENIAHFDAAFFNFSAETASTLDPQYRLQLESVYEALENAGITLQQIAGSNTSVFAGAFFHDYHDSLMRDPESLPRLLMTGNGATMASNRVSHFYDLLGPSMTLDTGCSTTLTALHQACQSLRMRETDMSIVGGSNIIINPDIFVTMGSLGLLSPDGKSYAFDSRANGYGRGEGVATVVLKRLDDALKARDPIRAVIRETHLNQDGKTETITSPSQRAQEELIRSCYSKAGLNPRAVQYFEAHGTGTPTGDPIEVGAIASVFKQGRSSHDPLLIGSVKTNLGHTEPTSGLASVIKVALALERGIIPPSVNFEKPNEQIPLEEWNLKVPIQCEKWQPGPDGVRRASVNNFGYGGANAHVIMENWPPRVMQNGADHAHVNGNGYAHGVELYNATDSSSRSRSRLFILSAKDEHACRAMAANLERYLLDIAKDREDDFLDNLAYTLGQRRTLFPWVSTYTAERVADLVKALDDRSAKPIRTEGRPKVGFVFTGQGAQWHAMGRELIEVYPVFKASLIEADDYLTDLGSAWSLLEELLRDAKTSNVNQVMMSTPLCIAIQISLVRLLESWGVEPAAVSSHSSGEIAAAYTAGALSYRSAMAISYCRGEITSVLEAGNGGMLAVGLSRDAVQAHLKVVKSGRANVACINSPSSVTVSGDVAAIDELEELFKDQNVFARRLKVGAAFHSHHMEPIAQSYLAQMQEAGIGEVVENMRPIKYVSPTTGARMTEAAEIGTPGHWVRSMLSPVLFVDSFRDMALDLSTQKAEVDLVIEVGPHAALSGPIGDILSLPELKESVISYHSCLVRNTSALHTMHTLAGQLICRGLPLDVGAVNFPTWNHSLRVLPNLPPYPWNHQVAHWVEPRINKSRRLKRHAPHDLLGSLVDGTNMRSPMWKHIIRVSELPWLRDHTVQSSIVYPGAGFICMAIEAVRQINQTTDDAIMGYRIRDVNIQQALVIPDDSSGIEVQTALEHVSDKALGIKGWMQFCISSVTSENAWTEHCKGYVDVLLQGISDNQGQERRPGRSCGTKPISPRPKDINPADMFSSMKSVGICHGPAFRNLESIQAGVRQSITTISIADVMATMPFQHQQSHILHPTTLDSIFVSAYSALPEADLTQNNPMVPKAIKNLWISHHISHEVGHKFRAYSKIDCVDSKRFCSTISLANANGACDAIQEPVLIIDGLTCESIGTTVASHNKTYKDDVCSALEWVPDVSLSDPSSLQRRLCKSMDQSEVDTLLDLSHACFHYIRDALRSLTASDVQRLEWHHRKYYDWMQFQYTLAREGGLGPGSCKWAEDKGDEIETLLDAVRAASVNGEMICRLGPNIAAILRQDITPLELMMDGKLLYRYYQDCLKFDRSNGQLSDLVSHFVHKTPRAKILEIGGGTGGATRWVLNAIGSSKSGTGPLASEYHFTDVSSGFFEAAKDEFVDWGDIMAYRKLDVEVDPTQQGFECGTYDLIIACQVLHATKNMENTMGHVRQLLKPGGKLMLFETTKDQVDMQLTFGLLPGWWLSEEKERSLSPTLSIPLWADVLKVSGFTGIDLEVHDCDSEEHYSFSVIMSTARSTERRTPPVKSVMLVTSTTGHDHDGASLMTLNDSITALIDDCVTTVGSLGSVEIAGRFCVYVGEVERPLLSQPSPAEFDAIKDLALGCSGLLWVTRGGAIDCLNPELALSSGFLRSLRNEYGGKAYASIDLDPRRHGLDESDACAIAKVLAAVFEASTVDESAPRDFEFAEREGVILVPRAYNDAERNRDISGEAANFLTTRKQSFNDSDFLLKLDIETPGLLESLRFCEVSQRMDLASHHIEVEPKAFGLNFRDVMTAMGQLDGKKMGLECSGVITRVGSDAAVQGYKIGDRVFCLLDGQYANRVRLPWTTACLMPADMTFEAAASVPMAFTTAYMSLYDKAKLRKGQTVLIHAAAGGVGQAAIVLSQLIGAEIFATAGTEQKRVFLTEKYGIPSDHVYSSRNSSFVMKLMAVTKGRGVDVVLNCLSGTLLQESFNCISCFGHFIEIGKYDLEHNNYLEMVPFTRAVSFSSIDVLAVIVHRPSEIHRILTIVASLIEQRVIWVTEPITIFALSEIENAFRHMQAGKQMGKIVLSSGRADTVLAYSHKPRVTLRADSSYLVVGGIGGLGRSVARWMLDHGAKSVILLSRSASGEGKRFANELGEAYADCRVTAIGCDITDAGNLSLALDDCAQKLPPIRGVIQGAMVLQDSILEQMTWDDYNAAIGPKVQGSWNLHQQLSSGLDFFIMLSSLAGVLGYASQSNYTAGGAYQDALARYRVSQGLPGVAIDLGVVRAVGYVATHKGVYERLTRVGHMTLSEEQVLAVIGSAILHPSAQIMVGLNTGPGPQWEPGTGSPLARESRFSALRYRESSSTSGVSRAHQDCDDLASKLVQALSFNEAADIIASELTRKLVDIFMIPPENISTCKSMAAFGVDSLVAVELRNMLALQAGAEISIFDIMQSPSLADLAGKVASKSTHVATS